MLETSLSLSCLFLGGTALTVLSCFFYENCTVVVQYSSASSAISRTNPNNETPLTGSSSSWVCMLLQHTALFGYGIAYTITASISCRYARLHPLLRRHVARAFVIICQESRPPRARDSVVAPWRCRTAARGEAGRRCDKACGTSE
jgi:hypothetical protein